MLADVPFIYVLIGFGCIGAIIGLTIGFLIKKRRQSNLSDYNIIEEINMGKYIVGFEEHNYEMDNMLCHITDNGFLFSSQSGNTIGAIYKDSLTNLFLEDKTSVAQRLTATRLLTLGVFSLAAPKKKKHKEYCIIFEWEDDNGEKNNVVFEFSGMACDVISKESFNKLNKYKPITTKKCPFCDETIRIKAKICKYCNKEIT
tara:strand:+ start:182 stop:784 length:603 start_codon:yes stop_codon:yes gene_type:complete